MYSSPYIGCCPPKPLLLPKSSGASNWEWAQLMDLLFAARRFASASGRFCQGHTASVFLADVASSAGITFAYVLLFPNCKIAPIYCKLSKIMDSRDFPCENTNKWKNIEIRQLKCAIVILNDTIKTRYFPLIKWQVEFELTSA